LPIKNFPHTAAAPPNENELDVRIEAWLRQTFGVEIDFAVNGALGEPEGSSLLRRRQERLFVSPRDGAIAQLQAIWDRFLGSGLQAPDK
jgi:hypothetical protein